ncbi:MAG: PD40 domain-containing protein [Acidobacteria bacterium]|nr:PD40 domain-containing protein [Acidobacteriota bacterium]
MKKGPFHRSLAILLLAGVYGVALAGAQRSDPADVLLQAAIHKETVEGDLEQAVRMYKDIVAKYSTNRAVAATAQYHLGLCYEKLGNTEARTAYERVLREYPEQSEPVSQARARLAALASSDTGDVRAAREPSGIVIQELQLGATQQTFALSPDGNSVVYTKGMNLVVRDFVSGRDRQITDVKTGSAYIPVWSPDGKRIAYTHWHNYWKYELRIVSLETGEDQHREINGRPSGWSVDGRHILYSEGGAEKARWSLNLLPVDGGPAREIMSGNASKQTVAPQGLRLSPDGKYVVYSLEKDRTSSSLFLVRIEGGDPIRITEGSTYDYDPIWAPDGKTLLFVSNRSLGRFDLWAVRVVDGKAAGEPFVVKPAIGRVRLLSLANNGRLLLSRHELTSHIYITGVDPDTGQGVGQAVRLTKESDAGDSQRQRPVWSPDGRYIAYIASRNTFRVVSADGSDDREIARLPGMFLGTFAWAPDNEHIYFAGKLPETGSGIHSISVVTKEIKPILLDPEIGGYVAASPDGKRLAFLKNLQRPQIFMADVDGGHLEQITFDESTRPFYASAWSPDGKQFVFGRSGGGKTSLMVRTVDDGRIYELLSDSKSGNSISDISWSHDGSKLAWSSSQDGKPAIEFLRLAPGETPQAFIAYTGLPANTVLLNPSWSPDGKRMAFVAGAEVNQLSLMDNFLPKPEESGQSNAARPVR